MLGYALNCLLAYAQVKIVDFGSAMFSVAQQGRAGCGLAAVSAMSCTPAFRSPESLAQGYIPSFEVRCCWSEGNKER
jgi:serine/threonine protein kinase